MAIHYDHPLDKTFHALGDGTRRQILSMLASKGALSAGDIRKPFNVAQPTISKHLKVLERAGLVRRDIVGRSHRFRLAAGPMKEAEDWISQQREFWAGTLRRLDVFVQTLDKYEEDA